MSDKITLEHECIGETLNNPGLVGVTAGSSNMSEMIGRTIARVFTLT